MSDKYAVIGNPVAHSRSPRIHALFAQQTAQNLDYTALLAPLDGFEVTVRDFIAAGGRGANVTVPFKEQAFQMATRLSPRAEAAGAANTLAFDGGEVFGDNTDGAGLVRDLECNLKTSITGKRVLLLGAGGAARGAILPLLEASPARLVIANRTADKAHQLATEFSLWERRPRRDDAIGPGTGLLPAACGFAELAGQHFDLIINATSAGLADAELPLPPGVFAPGCLAYEMLYGRDTPFMRQARQAGAQVADGLGMLVEQAAESFFLWRGLRPDSAPVLAELRRG